MPLVAHRQRSLGGGDEEGEGLTVEPPVRREGPDDDAVHAHAPRRHHVPDHHLHLRGGVVAGGAGVKNRWYM